MHLILPAIAAGNAYALVTFDAPNADSNGCRFSVDANGTKYAEGTLTQRQDPANYIPIIIVTKIPLSSQPMVLRVKWSASGPYNVPCKMDTFYSLSATLTQT